MAEIFQPRTEGSWPLWANILLIIEATVGVLAAIPLTTELPLSSEMRENLFYISVGSVGAILATIFLAATFTRQEDD